VAVPGAALPSSLKPSPLVTVASSTSDPDPAPAVGER
jgi:hypothetical protein